jgi:hypothetical protein
MTASPSTPHGTAGTPGSPPAPRQGLHILLGLQDIPRAAINATDVTTLSVMDIPMRPILNVLAVVGFLHDDRVPTIDRWF